MAFRNTVGWIYTDDDGQEYRTRAPKDITDQVNGVPATIVGGRVKTSADDVLPSLPKNASLRTRKAIMTSAGGERKLVVVYEKTADLFSNTPSGLNLPEYHAAASVAYTRNGRINERKRNTVDVT